MRITYSDRFSMEPHKDINTDEFMLIGHFKEEYLKHCIENHELVRRTNDNVVPDYLVYECDSLPLEDQLKIIDNLDHSYIRYITYSGSKSYHVLFKIKVPDDITNEEYREVWKDVMSYYQILDYADTACTNKSRLTRNPNGYRRKYENKTVTPTRIRQTCIFDNPNCETLDLTENVNAIREQLAINKAWQEVRNNEFLNSSRKPKDETVPSPEEVLSRIGKECAAKRGYEMYINNDYPKGEQYLSYAAGMYSVCIGKNCDEAETIDFIRSFLLEVSKYHPSNISERTARNWKPPRRYH